MDLIARPLDLIVIVFYLLGMAGLGVWFSRRNRNTSLAAGHFRKVADRLPFQDTTT
jgi:hypothetical protein